MFLKCFFFLDIIGTYVKKKEQHFKNKQNLRYLRLPPIKINKNFIYDIPSTLEFEKRNSQTKSIRGRELATRLTADYT